MEPLIPQEKKTSPWTYVGCTCGAIAILFMFAIAGVTFFAYRKGKEIKETFTDPAKREAKTREILAYKELPAGYYPAGAFSIPFAMDMAILSDEPSTPQPGKSGPDFKEHGFFYVSLRDFGKNHAQMEAYVRGTGPKPDFMRQNRTDFDESQVVTRGRLDIHGQPVDYATTRGTADVQGKSHRGLTALIYIPCPGDSRVRFGLWFGPDPDRDKPKEELDLKGTPADPAAITDFLGHFELCPKG